MKYLIMIIAILIITSIGAYILTDNEVLLILGLICVALNCKITFDVYKGVL